jgi:hypothetical protein
VRVADYKLHAAEAALDETKGSERQNASVSASPTSRPIISR